MKPDLRLLALGVFCLQISGCGFQPMYGQPETSSILFKDINISDQTPANPGQGRVSYLIEDALRNQLTAANAPDRTADLTIWTAERRDDLGVQANDAATRKDLYLTVRYSLVRRSQDGQTLKPISGIFTTVATYNIAQSPYAEITALEDARKRAAQDVAERITRDIAFQAK